MAIVRLHRAAPSRSRGCRLSLIALALVTSAIGCAAAESPAAPADDAQLVEGREIYIKSCASCHGGTGGGGTGSKIDEGRVTERYPDPEDQVALVSAGVRAMPAFEAKLTPAELDAVVRYTREVLAVG